MYTSSKSNLLELNSKIIKCIECKEVSRVQKKIAKDKRKMYQNETYWGKPIVGFGDENAKLLIIGLLQLLMAEIGQAGSLPAINHQIFI